MKNQNVVYDQLFSSHWIINGRDIANNPPPPLARV